jgi:hypothetical protein
MMNIKRFFSLALMAFIIVSAAAAQDGEQQQTRMDLTGFKTVYDSDGLEMRNRTIKDISEAIANGDNTNDDIYAALEYMSMEGLKNIARARGKILNNYPSVRLQVSVQLGKMGSAKASEILNQVLNNENDLYVLQETFNSLGELGYNENDSTVKTIIWKLRTYNPRSPDALIDRVVLAAINALDKIDRKNNGIKNQDDFREVQSLLDRINKGHFSRPVQERAKKVLEDMLRRETERK